MRIMSDIYSFSVQTLEKLNGDFRETAALELEKMAVSLTELPGPTTIN